MAILNKFESKSFQAVFSVIRDIVIIIGVIFSIVSVQNIVRQTEIAAKLAKESTNQTALNTKQIKEASDIASAQFVDVINQRIKSDKYNKIFNAIEGNDNVHANNYKVWDQDGGQFTENEIADYIDNFEEIGNLYINNLVDKQMAYNEFSYDAEKAWCNSSIQDMIKSNRDSDGSGKYNDFRTDWWGFQQLVTISLKLDNKNCDKLNNE